MLATRCITTRISVIRTCMPSSLSQYRCNKCTANSTQLLSTQSNTTEHTLSTLHRLFSSSHDSHSSSHTSKPWTNPALQPQPHAGDKPQTVHINIITMEGKRTTVDGKVGESLLQALKHSDVGSMLPANCRGGGQADILYGEGPSCRSCHVYVDPTSLQKLPPRAEGEVKMSKDIAAATEHTRFSCEIELTPELNDITVVIPEYRKYELSGGS